MKLIGKLLGKICAAAALAASIATPTQAFTLTLTPEAILAGFSLTGYYSDPAATYGVLSLANGPDGFLYAAGYARSELYKFNDVDGQTYASRLLTASAGGQPTGIAAVGGQVYLGNLGQSSLYRVATDLTRTPIALTPGITFDYGLWGNPITGHLIASTSTGLVDIDPATGAWVQIGPAGVFVDGVSVSPDGTIAYGAYTGDQTLRGYSLTSPNPAVPVFNHFVGHGLDGSGVISGGLFNGDIVVNNNDGTLGIVNHLTGIETIIATGGSRGDLVSADLSNGTLLLDQYEGVMRLSCGEGCSIGSQPTSGVPEPASLALLGLGLLGLGFSLRRKTA